MFNLEKVICFMDWNSLFSGFLGSLVGAGITAIVVYQTARWQVKKTFKIQMDWETGNGAPGITPLIKIRRFRTAWSVQTPRAPTAPEP